MSAVVERDPDGLIDTITHGDLTVERMSDSAVELYYDGLTVELSLGIGNTINITICEEL